MNFSKPSVSRAMSILKKSGYIIMEPDGRIVLTENGLKKAASVLDRHKTLTVFLTDILNVPPDTAEKDACRIEHIISPVTFAGIKKMVKENRKK
jgi:Mn-dependent DtxR family transcriptional regulator